MQHKHKKINVVWIAVVIVVTLLTGAIITPSTAVKAQDPAVTLPSIITFRSDLAQPLTLNMVEAGEQEITLAWQVIGLREGDQLALDTYRVNNWDSLTQVDAPALEGTGSMVIRLQHPLNFGVPTYRLSIMDSAGTIVDEWILTIPYDVSQTTGSPQITNFSVLDAETSTEMLNNGTARITVGWEVSNRLSTTNLIFEQVMLNDEVVSVELPRAFLWIPSTGQGELAPVTPQGENFIRLRVRLVDLTTNSTIHERHLTLPIGDQNGDTPVIQEFIAEPAVIDRDGQVTITWSVSGAEVVLVGQVDADGFYLEPDEPMPAVGSMTFTALETDYYTASFFIYAGDEEGVGTNTTTTVDVSCPYTYFFGEIPAVADSCPHTDVLTMPAAHQIFERGDMIWRSDLGQIIAIYSDGTYERFEDTYIDDEEIVYPVSEDDVPEGLLMPIRGFAKIWANNDHVRSQLGWAQQAEIGYDATVQRVADGTLGNEFSDEYFIMPNSQLIALYADGTWQLVPFSPSSAPE